MKIVSRLDRRIFGGCMLLITAIVWGFAFVAQTVALDDMGVFGFNALRYLVGGIVLLPVIAVMNKLQKRRGTTFNKTAIFGGICCGVCLFIASSFQQTGLKYTSVGHCSFITAMYVVFVPMVETIMGRKNKQRIQLCVLLAIFGMFLLTVSNEKFSFSKGDLIVLVGSLCFTAHIMVIDHFSPLADGVTISSIQFFTASVLSGIAMLFTEVPPTFSQISTAIIPILYAGIMSCGVAYTLQVVFQKDVPATPASIILCLESVFGVIGGWLLLGQSLSLREIIGCLIMFAAIILAQL